MIVKPSVATYKYTLDGTTEGNTKMIATSARELIAVVVTGGSADTVVGIYDTKDATKLDPKTALYLGCNQGESVSFTPDRPVPYRNGMYVQIEQGGSPFNGKVFLLMD